MHSSKITAQIVIDSLKDIGVEHIIISPGSRNAPLVIECVETNLFKLHSIIDERSAGFVALGIAQQTEKPVALLCTSGSAVLNYAPAFAEAYYMKIPLIAVSADRPKKLIGMADGQTINQTNALNSVTIANVDLPELDNLEDKNLRFFYRELINCLNKVNSNPKGPIHINLPFSEPLYEQVTNKISLPFPSYNFEQFNQVLFDKNAEISKFFGKELKALLLIGQRNFDLIENQKIINFSEKNNIPILVETTSNLLNYKNALSIDCFLEGLNQREVDEFQPDVLITYKTNIVSKKLKSWLKKNITKRHIHLGVEHHLLDTYNSLNLQLNLDSDQFFSSENCQSSPDYFENLNAKFEEIKTKSKKFSCDFSDFKVFEVLSKKLSAKTKIIFGNSASIRYAQLFEEYYNFETFCNRGTSGIEGSLSTAVGAAIAFPENNFMCILGDTSFFYDSNALLNPSLPKNLKIIVINNNGGGIFRIIEGPKDVKHFEKFIETEHNFTAEFIARNFNVKYFQAKSETELIENLSKFEDSSEVSLLEIFTPKKTNDSTLKAFFKTLKE